MKQIETSNLIKTVMSLVFALNFIVFSDFHPHQIYSYFLLFTPVSMDHETFYIYNF